MLTDDVELWIALIEALSQMTGKRQDTNKYYLALSVILSLILTQIGLLTFSSTENDVRDALKYFNHETAQFERQ